MSHFHAAGISSERIFLNEALAGWLFGRQAGAKRESDAGDLLEKHICIHLRRRSAKCDPREQKRSHRAAAAATAAADQPTFLNLRAFFVPVVTPSMAKINNMVCVCVLWMKLYCCHRRRIYSSLSFHAAPTIFAFADQLQNISHSRQRQPAARRGGGGLSIGTAGNRVFTSQ